MSINFCTISNSTLDSFCGNRRSIIISKLLEEKYPPINTIFGTNNQNVSTDFAKQYPHLVRHTEFEDKELLQFEQPFITVSAELFGKYGEQTVETKIQMEFVTVTDFNIKSDDETTVSVSISDFTI